MNSIKVGTLSRESIEQHRQWCIGKGLAENTVKAFSTDLRLFLEANPTIQEVPLDELETLAQTWLNLTRTTMAAKTTGRRLVSFRSFLKWAGRPDILADYSAPTPSKGIPHPLPGLKHDLLKLGSVSRNPNQKALVGLMGFVGCRVSEARSVMPNNIDLETMMIAIHGKGDKRRIVPISDEGWKLIIDAYVFAKVSNTPLITYGDRYSRQCIKDMGRWAGISREIASHDLRMTYGTEIFNKTGDIRVTQELLGHESSSTTEIYTGVTQAKMRDAVEF